MVGTLALMGCKDHSNEKVLVLRYNSKGQVIEAYSSTCANVKIWDSWNMVKIYVPGSDKTYYIPREQTTVIINEPNLNREGQFIKALEAPEADNSNSM